MKIEKWKKELIFLAKFFGLFLAFEWILRAIKAGPLQEFIARSQAQFFGLQNTQNLIVVPDGVFEINESCTGLVSTIILGSIVFSLRKPGIAQKTAVFLAGGLLLLALNYFRVLVVIFVGMNYGMDAAEIVHVLTWFTTTAFVIGIWYIFTKKISNVRNFAGFL